MFDYFYNQNLRKLVVGFGALFSNIEVAHTNPAGGSPITIQVPIHYASQEKFIQRLLQSSSITPGTRIETQVPVISFMMNSISPDPSRRLGRFANNSNLNGCQTTGSKISIQTPVNVTFNLFVYTRHTDDMLQIIEQIMPNFLPEHIIQLDMNSVQTNLNIPITMVSNNLSERYDGDLNSRRLNIASFQFLAKSWIFGEIEPATAISNVVSNPIIDFD